MDQLICASLSHTHYWYEVGMLKVPTITVNTTIIIITIIVVNRVLPREVAQAVKVPTTLVSRSWVRMPVRSCLGLDPLYLCPFWASAPMCTTGNVPSMHVCSGDTTGTTIVPTCSPQYSPLLASRAYDTVEMELI